MSNKHSFIAYIRNKRSFSLIIDNLAIAVNWIAGIKISRIRIIVSQMLIQMRLPLTVQIKRIRITNILFRMRTNIVHTISARWVRVVANMRQQMRFVHTISARRVTIGSFMRQVSKLGSVPIKLYKIVLGANMLIAQFYLLSTYDPQTLSAMDATDLEDLDYVVA